MRAGIYARYSSDNQEERSIDDQVRICREFIERRGDMVADVFADYEISGASLKLRPQALRLVDELRAEKMLCPTAGDNVVRLLPPLIIGEEEMSYAITAIDRACTRLATKQGVAS